MSRFSWQMQGVSDIRGLAQTAYRIIVMDEHEHQVWDSQRISDDKSLNIKYGGLPLKAGTRYLWTVHVWDHKNNKASASSWFETGLMSNDRAYQAWSDAKWISKALSDNGCSDVAYKLLQQTSYPF